MIPTHVKSINTHDGLFPAVEDCVLMIVINDYK